MTTDRTQEQDQRPDTEGKAPVFSSWNRFYLFVILHLAFLIVLFYLVTTTFD